MLRLACCSFVLALAACPAKKASTPQAAGAGCPPASGVYFATYVSAKGHTGWVVALHVVPGGSQAEEYVNIDAATATAAGAPAAPTGTLWLAMSTGQPCRATLGKYYAVRIEGPPAAVGYGVELDGCPAPAQDEGAVLLASDAAPTGCRFETPRPVAARVGVMANKTWQRPTKETPIPAPIAAAITDKPCSAPACEKLWAFEEVKINGQITAWTGAINWVSTGDPKDACTWPAERESGTWIASGGAAVKVTEAQQHPLKLSAVLADGGGAKVLVAEGPGEYATYDLSAGKAALGHHVTWQIVPPETWEAVDHLVYCPPENR
jgi:hypothetical protein